jgi:phage terminase small subunit
MKTENNEKWPDPPDFLSEKARKLYFFYIGRTIKTPGQIALFVRGLESMDVADECGRVIREEGLSVKSERSKMVRQNPLLNTQRQATSEMLKIWRMLDLNIVNTWNL